MFCNDNEGAQQQNHSHFLCSSRRLPPRPLARPPDPPRAPRDYCWRLRIWDRWARSLRWERWTAEKGKRRAGKNLGGRPLTLSTDVSPAEACQIVMHECSRSQSHNTHSVYEVLEKDGLYWSVYHGFFTVVVYYILQALSDCWHLGRPRT